MFWSSRHKLLFGVIFVFAAYGFEVDHRGFLLTAPNTLYVNSNETMCISFNNIYVNGSITVKLTSHNYRILKSTSISIIRGESSCFDLLIPPTSSSRAFIEVEGNFRSISYTFSNAKKVTISQNSLMTFIETDKKIYKHGQKVRFRIFRLTNKLLPVLKPVSEVWIENPSGVRLAQWRKPHIERGLTDLSFELSDEPPLGEWSICLENKSGIKEKQSFFVQEYVLPKFEITMITPDVLFKDFESFRLKACALYTYGRPVHGKLNVGAMMNSMVANKPYAFFSPNISFNLVEGCHELTVFSGNFTDEDNVLKNTFSLTSINKIESEKSMYIKYFAEVIEHGTGVKINKSQSRQIFRTRLQFEYKSKLYFKPSMPYFGKVVVQHRNGNPAVNEELVLNVVSDGETLMESKYITDNLGEVNFVFEPKGNQTHTILLKETSGLISNSNMTKSLMSWYSPTKSFLQVGAVNQKIGCASNRFDLQVNFTMTESIINEEITFFYQIASRGSLLTQRNKTFVYDNLRQTPRMSSDGLRIGSITLPINLSPQMSPFAHLLVYFIRKDNELVSDSQEIAIENCFENNVTLSFDNDEILPSKTSIIEIMAQPQSICALSVVDKSAHLLSSDNFLDIDKVFQVISKTYSKNVPASNTHERGCIYGHHCRQHNYHPDKYVENDKAFNDAGLVAIRNLNCLWSYNMRNAYYFWKALTWRSMQTPKNEILQKRLSSSSVPKPFHLMQAPWHMYLLREL